MSKFVIIGRKKLFGEVAIGGSKNAVLPILAATVLINGKSTIHNCPNISDTHTSIEILRHLGCKVLYDGYTAIVDATNIDKTSLPTSHVQKMRSSIIFAGALLSRFGEFSSTTPGGCRLGERPIDMHINAFSALGATFDQNPDIIAAKADKLIGNTMCLSTPSVGATQNAMLAAVYAKGEITITNAAKEPEVVDLQNFLNKAGANINGAGTETIAINGVTKLHSAEYSIMPDRIVAGTYLVAGAISRGNITLKNVNYKDVSPVAFALAQTGAKIVCHGNEINLTMKHRPIALPSPLTTAPHPGFPTDMQPQFTALLATAHGTSTINEKLFEARDAHIAELSKMGAKITNTDNRRFLIEGVAALRGRVTYAKDLRGGAALILAGLASHGITVVENAHYIQRGYEDIAGDLKQLGAAISFLK